jgi:competence protein ComGC
MKKMVFALLILHLKSSVLLSLSTTVSQVRERVGESGSIAVVVLVHNSKQQFFTIKNRKIYPRICNLKNVK